MKRLSLFFAIILLVSATTWVLKAQTKPKEAPKSYEVKLSLDQWQLVLNGLEVIKNAVKTSNMPASQATYLSDSIIVLYQSEFSRQLQQQLADEKKGKPETKKDSTKKN